MISIILIILLLFLLGILPVTLLRRGISFDFRSHKELFMAILYSTLVILVIYLSINIFSRY